MLAMDRDTYEQNAVLPHFTKSHRPNSLAQDQYDSRRRIGRDFPGMNTV